MVAASMVCVHGRLGYMHCLPSVQAETLFFFFGWITFHFHVFQSAANEKRTEMGMKCDTIHIKS